MSVRPGIVTFYPTELERVLYAPGGEIGRYFNYVARAVAVEAADLADQRLHRRTGRLAEGYHIEVDRVPPPEGFVFYVVNSVTGQSPRRNMSYALVMELGSQPHEIRPRAQADFLVFYIAGRKIITKKVNHPGTKPYNILSDALTNVKERLGF